MPRLPDEYTYKLLYIYTEKEKAICVSVEPNVLYEQRFWLPKSQIEYDEDWKIGDQLEIKIPDWLIVRLEEEGRLKSS